LWTLLWVWSKLFLQCDLVESAQTGRKDENSNTTVHNLAYTVNTRTQREHRMYVVSGFLNLPDLHAEASNVHSL
jgi:hypothetical protein